MSSQNPDLASLPAGEEEEVVGSLLRTELEVAAGEEELQLLGSEGDQAAAGVEEERHWSRA